MKITASASPIVEDGVPLAPMALGGSLFGDTPWKPEYRETLMDTMSTALSEGITHFDTAADYGGGTSERVVGEFVRERREKIFLASKASIDEMDAALMHKQVDAALDRLGLDYIDLFYIHWPRKGKDPRPLMEGLMQAREKGKIHAIGVSNFSAEQMAQVEEVGVLDVHQLGYNLFWRAAEQEVIPYCRKRGIAVVTYSSIAQGILTGKFSRELHFEADDQRRGIALFQPEVWPHIYDAVEKLKVLAEEADRPLVHLAIRWVLHQSGIHTAVVGAKNASQASSNAAALAGGIDSTIFDRMSEISDEVRPHLPDWPNMYNHVP